MKTAGFILGGTMIALGLMAIAGSAGDWDGKCGPGNDIGTMLMIVFWGMVSVGLGGLICAKTNDI